MKMNLRRSIIIVILSLSCVTGFAQTEALDTYLRARMKNQSIPGLALAIVTNGQIASLKTLGMAGVELQIPVTLASVFEIASLNKQFTAAVMPAEEGKMDRIGKFFAHAPDAGTSHRNDQLVRHQAT